MLRVFSGSCMSLDDMDYIRPKLREEPHLLGPGTDYFDEKGVPQQPQPSGHMIQKVFSGSALDLNAMNVDDDDASPLPSPKNMGTPHTIIGSLSAESEAEQKRLLKSKTTVLVIGASGYVSAHVVGLLLEAGYTVICTVKDMLEHHTVGDIRSLSPADNSRLSVFEADITNRDSLRDHVRNAKFVIHCGISANELQGRNVVNVHEEAVKALFDAIRSYGRGSVKRVILMGSAGAVYHNQDPTPKSGAFDETMWNSVSTPEQDPVQYAKVRFEKEAWRLRESVGVELSVILPSIVIGPSKTDEVSEAMRTIHDLACGSSLFPFAPRMFWNFADVRDVAAAHVAAMESPVADGKRYLLNSECMSLSQIGRHIRAEYDHLSAPIYDAPTLLTLIVGPLSNARVSMSFLWRNLGVKKPLSTKLIADDLRVEARPIAKTIHDSVDELIQGGHLPAAGDAQPSSGNSKVGILSSVVVIAIGGAVAYKYFTKA